MNLPVRVRTTFKYALLTLLLLVATLTFLSNYTAGLYIVIGAIAFLFLLVDITRFGCALSIVGIGLALGGLLIGAVIWILGNLSGPASEGPLCEEGTLGYAYKLTGYEAQVEPIDLEQGSFRVNEHIVYQQWERQCNVFEEWEYSKVLREGLERDLPSRTVYSTRSGWFLQEVTIPINTGQYDCCPSEANAVVKSLPYRLFYDAEDADDINKDEYLGKETIRWKIAYRNASLRFAYFRPPFHNLRTLLSPFIELSKYDNPVLAAIGFGLGAVGTTVLKPALIDYVINKLKTILKREPPPPPPSSPPRRPVRRVNRNQ